MVSDCVENELSAHVVDCAFKIHTRYGPGLLESLYERVLAYELRKRGLDVQVQVPIPLVHEELIFDEAFRADLIVNNVLLVELKSIEKLAPVHKKQVNTYLKLTAHRLGLLINFGEEYIKDGIHRIANGLPS